MRKVFEWFFVIVFAAAAGLIINTLVQKKLKEDRAEYFIGQGRSMEPALFDGDELKVDPKEKPREEDLIVFRCERCMINEDMEDIMAKRLKLINADGCFWVEGDNKEVSLDSRDKKIDWLCPEDIELFGVVIEVNRPSN